MISRISHAGQYPSYHDPRCLEDKAKQCKVLKSGDPCLASCLEVTDTHWCPMSPSPRALVTVCHKLSKFPAKAPTQREPKPTPDSWGRYFASDISWCWETGTDYRGPENIGDKQRQWFLWLIILISPEKHRSIIILPSPDMVTLLCLFFVTRQVSVYCQACNGVMQLYL